MRHERGVWGCGGVGCGHVVSRNEVGVEQYNDERRSERKLTAADLDSDKKKQKQNKTSKTKTKTINCMDMAPCTSIKEDP